MNILYFHQYFCTIEGNSGIRSYEMAKQMVNNGHKVTMIFAESPRLKSPLSQIEYVNGSRRGKYNGIDLIEFNLYYSNKMDFIKRSIVFIKFSIRSVFLIFREQYDIVFATSTPITAGIPGIVMKLMHIKKPFVFEVRDLWPELPREMGVLKNKFVLWLLEKLETVSYNCADACVALSPGIETGIRRKLKKEKLIYMIPNGCDLDLFKPGEYSKTVFPGCNENDFIAVFIGAHGIANGLNAALNAAVAIPEHQDYLNIKVVLIGDGKEKEGLRKRIKDESIQNVILLDPVPKKDLLHYLWAADIGLMLLSNIPAFYYGTSPNKFFDYISCGLPVLNNYPGWLADMITQNELGVVVKPDDPREFANALISLSKDRDKVKRMGLNARIFAEKSFDRRKLASDFENALNTTIQNFKN